MKDRIGQEILYFKWFPLQSINSIIICLSYSKDDIKVKQEKLDFYTDAINLNLIDDTI